MRQGRGTEPAAWTAACLLVLLIPHPARAAADDDDPKKPVTEVMITARRLDAARSNIEPSLGSATYTLSNEVVENRPFGETTSINQILLQLPGVVQDGSGQLHVRQSHGDLQYRINNVIIPEGASDLGESLSARIAAKVQLVTGALPAQYGGQAGGVINVTTKSGAYLGGGQAEIYGGSHGTLEPAFEWGNSAGPTSLFVSGSVRRTTVGLAGPDRNRTPDHDRTDQIDGFAFLDQVLNAETRASLILGTSDERFQLPNAHGLAPAFTVAGAPPGGGEQVDGNRREATRYAIASLMRATEKTTLQGSVFVRRSVRVEQTGGLAALRFTGLGAESDETATAYGVQLEGVWEAAAAHTVRSGLVLSQERARDGANYLVLPVDAAGAQTSTTPTQVSDIERRTVRKASVFLQDEWRATGDLTLNLGGRLDQVSGSGARFSPRVSAVYTLPGGEILHAGYARYVLPVPASERDVLTLAGTSGRSPTTPADPLRPETDDYVDIGLQAQPFAGLTAGVDAYWRRARDYLSEGRFGPAALTAAFNYGSAQLRGVEFTANYVSGPLSAWGNLTVAQSTGRRIVSNQRLFTAQQLAQLGVDTPMAFDQTVTGSGGVAWRFGPWRVSGSVLAGSGLPRTPVSAAVNSGHLSPYAQADIAVVYHHAQAHDRSLDLRLDIGNLFDTAYRLRDGTGVGDGPAQWSTGRGVYIGAEQSF